MTECENCAKRFAEGFYKGQQSVKRKNQSGCCCVIDDNYNVITLCGAHADYFDQKLEMV